MPRHVFISYVREDRGQVDRIESLLRDAGIPVWRDVNSLWPGDDWRRKIRQAITDDAFAFIACFSRASNARELSGQNAELDLAIEQLRLRRPDLPWLIPVRLDDCEIPEFEIGAGRTLKSLHWVDLFGSEETKSGQRLMEAVGPLVGPRRPRPTNSFSNAAITEGLRERLDEALNPLGYGFPRPEVRATDRVLVRHTPDRDVQWMSLMNRVPEDRIVHAASEVSNVRLLPLAVIPRRTSLGDVELLLKKHHQWQYVLPSAELAIGSRTDVCHGALVRNFGHQFSLRSSTPVRELCIVTIKKSPTHDEATCYIFPLFGFALSNRALTEADSATGSLTLEWFSHGRSAHSGLTSGPNADVLTAMERLYSNRWQGLGAVAHAADRRSRVKEWLRARGPSKD